MRGRGGAGGSANGSRRFLESPLRGIPEGFQRCYGRDSEGSLEGPSSAPWTRGAGTGTDGVRGETQKTTSGSGVFCTKTRVFGPRSTARFGHQAPVAFLASWLSAASRFTDKSAHMRFVPGVAAVGEAMEKLRSDGLEG